MKCIICEKELEPVSETSHMQPYGGGEVKVSFHYGSRFDWLGSQRGIEDPNAPVQPDPIAKIFGKKSDKMVRVISEEHPGTTEPVDGALNHEKRAIQLTSCSHIYGVMCDDCFEAKAHLFQGFVRPPTPKLKLTVE